ncbi:hypothetical protein IJ118_00840 [Candidatus Saccharibacteria bacterium]|nr:hypothetical protein [Candidatus Saccharibacteria bacterium]
MDEGLAKIRHDRSKKDYPFLKLEDGEYVEYAFMRAKIALIAVFFEVAVGLAIVLLAFLLVLMGQNMLDQMGRNFLYMILGVIVIMAFLICVVAWIVYRGNRLYVTNRRVIQMVMKAPLATSVNMIDLASIEDASFHQSGLAQKLFHYGTLRLSTVGEETTYTFTHSDITPEELKNVSRLVTDAKKKNKSEEK